MEIQSPKDEEERRMNRKWPSMKAAQLQEFQMQTLVYRYIEAGLRVPHHLVVPIRNSLALSSSLLSDKALSFSNTVELEPTRCRRTDGKKWRCKTTVLPFEKYCERHMHRGKRSRKLVESPSSSTKQDISNGLVTVNESQSVTHETMSVSSNAQVVTVASLPSDSASARAYAYVTRPSLVMTESINRSVRRKKHMEMSYDDFLKQRESNICVQGVPVQGDDEGLPCVQKFFPEVSDNVSLEASSIKKNHTLAKSRESKDMNVNRSLFPDLGGFRFHKIEIEKEPGRCRRTDGKRWRCGKGVLTGEKYCDKHMHRGIRKNHTNNSHEDEDDNNKKKLSISAVSRVSDEKRTTSSCSTDTTITDTRGEEEDNDEVLSLCSSGV